MRLIRAVALAAVPLLLSAGPALAQYMPFQQPGVSNPGSPLVIQGECGTVTNSNGAVLGVPCAPGTGPTPVASTTPTALTPNTIATTGTYQQAFPAGAATTTGGVLQAPASNAAAVCLDVSKAAVAGATTPTGGQVCAQPGYSISFPATAGAGFVYGTAGDTFSGSAS